MEKNTFKEIKGTIKRDVTNCNKLYHLTNK